LDTDGNVFGGFTPVKWESGLKYKGDDSLRSFLFTLRNLHGVPPRKFALRKEEKESAIYCNFNCGPQFGNGIGVQDNCNRNRKSWTYIGTRYKYGSYGNDTRFEEFLTGAEYFTVKEIEVFESDETAVSANS
jgi:hypothetical protein